LSCITTLTNIGDFAKFTQGEPLHYVTKLVGWHEEIKGSGTLKREFRWGTTNRVRASWMDLTVQNLQQVILNPADDLYVDFRYTLVAGGPCITIEDLYIEYEQSVDASDPFYGYRPPMLVSEHGNISNLTKIVNFTFRPYQVNQAVVLYKELAGMINRMFGHDVQYARAVPMAIGKDFTLHEWTLYDVDDPCPLKVIVPNNEFPDSKIQFNPFGLDFEMPFEVHIVKDYFEENFGIGTAPQKRDIIYFPLTNRIFEIDSSYLWKDIMQREVYWKVSLTKYQPKSNRYEPQDLREQLDTITWNSEERFGEEVRLDELKVTKPQQYDPKLGSRNYDPIRLSVEDNLVISQSHFKNYSIVLSESQYDLRSIYNPQSNNIAVTYRADSVFPAAPEEERSLCAWFKDVKPKNPALKDAVKGQMVLGVPGANTTPLSFTISANRNYANGDLIKLTRFNGFSAYGSFISKTPVVGGFIITISVRNEIVQFLNTYYANWASASVTSGYNAELTQEVIMMDGWDGSAGWKLSLYANRYFIFKSTSGENLFIIPNNIIQDSWYAYFLNVNNYYRQVSLDLWIRKWDEYSANPLQTTDLENIYSNAIIVLPTDRSASSDYKYRLPASNTLCTNIRLFKKSETDLQKQMLILNETIVQDTQWAIIIDNALPRLTLPWIAKTK
jgi:hypothetical protein